MAINWTDAQIEEVVAAVIKNLGAGAPTVKSEWDSTQYNGRKLVGIYADMNDAIEAARAGYKAIRAMSIEERERGTRRSDHEEGFGGSRQIRNAVRVFTLERI